MKRRFTNLSSRLNKQFKRKGELSDRTLETLEDKYNVNLTSFYGEEDPKTVKRIIGRISKANPIRTKSRRKK